MGHVSCAKRFVKEYMNYLINDVKVGGDKGYQIQKAYCMCDKGMITQLDAIQWMTRMAKCTEEN